MTTSKRTIYRRSAVQHYLQRRERDVLPRFVSPPIFFFLWVLLGLLLMAGALAWFSRLPVQAFGVGIIIEPEKASEGAVVLVFAPADQRAKLRPGQTVHLQLSPKEQISSQVASVEPGITSPAEARQRYGLKDGLALAITKPSAVFKVKLAPDFSLHNYAGSVLPVEVETGSRRLISLLPGLASLSSE